MCSIPTISNHVQSHIEISKHSLALSNSHARIYLLRRTNTNEPHSTNAIPITRSQALATTRYSPTKLTTNKLIVTRKQTSLTMPHMY